MSELVLYTMARTRGSIALWLLEELGRPYELRVMERGQNREPDFLKINPMGKVPTILHDGVVVTEAAAIACYLADAFPEAGLSVPIGDPQRGPYLKWLFFGPSCFEPAMSDKAFPRAEPPGRSTLGWGDFETVLDVMAAGVAKGPWLMGERFTAADVIIGSGLRFGTAFKMVPDRPEFRAYLGRLAERPALKRADAKEQELAA